MQRWIRVGDIALQITDPDSDCRFGEHRAKLRLARREGLFGLPSRAQPCSVDRILFVKAALAQRVGVAGGHAGGQLRDPFGNVSTIRKGAQQARQLLGDQREGAAQCLGAGEMRRNHVNADLAAGRGIELHRERRINQPLGESKQMFGEHPAPHRHVAGADDRLGPTPGERLVIVHGHARRPTTA
ncbi:MAG TPA: hypothetical protein VE673_19380 [Pseudonocardiaceae bacterium]|nr:hypothetical protein [Pseudonocardiaceae bacterium]